MDVSKAKELIQMLKSEGVEYYKDSEVELYLRPSLTAANLPAPARDEDDRPLPEIYRKLPGNYSHPSLFPKSR